MVGRIIGMGSCVPQNIVTNFDLEKIVETNDEWIVQRTGIESRRISTGETTTDLSVNAAKKAIKSANISPEDIDLIIVATITPDNHMPSTACLVQAEIGAKNATAFDIGAACSGFVYGLNIANQFIKSNTVKTALVIGAEVLSKVLNWSDRNTCVLFGDGAGAAIVRGDETGIINYYTGSKGDVDGLLTLPAIDQVNNPYCKVKTETSEKVIGMDGTEVFKFALSAMKKSIKNVIKETDVSIDDVKYIVPHQANKRIVMSVAKKMKIDESKFYMCMDHYGNTSAASIPLALDEMDKANLLEKGDKIVLVGFGGGLTWGSILIEW